jgi:hypothetical protein
VPEVIGRTGEGISSLVAELGREDSNLQLPG